MFLKWAKSLQWGRFPKEAEIPPGPRESPPPAQPSMGPLPEGSGNVDGVEAGGVRAPNLQWGRFPKEAEIKEG